ncbi:SAM-dependent DNA methyltransferase [Candidatus Poribacteria bacterium]|nr:SAM-dependent DNA methyltransferase [Candidatus Poribacteria bacterium]
MNTNQSDIENRLWATADELRANSNLKASEYSTPVLGLIFLKYADHKFHQVREEINSESSVKKRFKIDERTQFQARGAFYLPEKARFKHLLKLPESDNIAQAVTDAMKAIEAENKQLEGVLPKSYNRLEKSTLIELLRIMEQIPEIEGDAFGKVYEYFLGNFAMSEGQKGGQFFTPTSLVKLIVEILQPYHGRILDPACGSGGMFVQSEDFIRNHKQNGNQGQISIYGIERVAETIKLCKMNLAVHGHEGDIKQASSYYEDPHKMLNKFDYVMANPPFNVDRVDMERIKDDPRFPYRMPSVDNANYIWIQLFLSSLNENGRAGFVMANSAADARSSELKIRKQIIQSNVVDVMISISSNFFYTVTLPCTLWFFDKSKKDSDRAKKVLFIDARKLYEQVSRAHREFTPEHIEFLGNIARLYRGETPENLNNNTELLDTNFPNGEYVDVPGLCKVATIEEIEAQGWSLNPGRYVGVAPQQEEDFDFAQRFQELNEELEILNTEAHQLEEQIAKNVTMILEDIQ